MTDLHVQFETCETQTPPMLNSLPVSPCKKASSAFFHFPISIIIIALLSKLRNLAASLIFFFPSSVCGSSDLFLLSLLVSTSWVYPISMALFSWISDIHCQTTAVTPEVSFFGIAYLTHSSIPASSLCCVRSSTCAQSTPLPRRRSFCSLVPFNSHSSASLLWFLEMSERAPSGYQLHH